MSIRLLTQENVEEASTTFILRAEASVEIYHETQDGNDPALVEGFVMLSLLAQLRELVDGLSIEKLPRRHT